MTLMVNLLMNPWVIRGVATGVTLFALLFNLIFAKMSKSREWDTGRFGAKYRLFAIINVLSLLSQWSNILRVETHNSTHFLCAYGVTAFVPHPFPKIIDVISHILGSFNLWFIPWLLYARRHIILGAKSVDMGTFYRWFFTLIFLTRIPYSFIASITQNEYPTYIPNETSFKPSCVATVTFVGENASMLQQILNVLVLPITAYLHHKSLKNLEKRRSHITDIQYLNHSLFIKTTAFHGYMAIFELFSPLFLILSTYVLPTHESVSALFSAYGTTIAALTPLLQALVAVIKSACYRISINRVRVHPISSSS